MKKKEKFYDYRNPSLYDRIYSRLFYTGHWANFKYITRELFWARMRGLYSALSYPWWLLKFWYSLIVRFIYWFPRFIKSIPGMPRRFYYYVIDTYKTNVNRVFREHTYLRKRGLKKSIIHYLKIIIVIYFFLSFILEFKLHTNHEFYVWNKWWITIFEYGFLWSFIGLWVYTIIWLCSLYFVGWKYWMKTYWLYYWWGTLSGFDVCCPDMAHEWLFMIVQTIHIPTYLFCAWYSWNMNDLVEYYHARKPLPSYKTFSWEYDHYRYRAEEESDPKVRENLQNHFQYIKMRDLSNRWPGTF